jgi:hypothetical protein
MFVKDQVVGIPVQLFKGELRCISVVNLVDGVREDFPGLRGNCSVHRHMCPERLFMKKCRGKCEWALIQNNKLVRRLSQTPRLATTAVGAAEHAESMPPQAERDRSIPSLSFSFDLP